MANWWDQMGTTIGDNLIGMQMPFGMEPPTDPQQRAQMINPMLMQIGASMLAGRKQNPAVNVGNALMGAQAMGQQNMGRQLYASQLADARESRKEEKERENQTLNWFRTNRPDLATKYGPGVTGSDVLKILADENKPKNPTNWTMSQMDDGVYAVNPETLEKRYMGKSPARQSSFPTGHEADPDNPGKVRRIPGWKDTDYQNKLRSEFLGQTKDFRDSRDSYNRIQASAQNPSPAGDLALIFNYMKMLDPGSVVRETEFATAQTAAPFLTRVGIDPEKVSAVWAGQRLTPEQRADFIRRADAIYGKQEQTFDTLAAEYKALAEREGFDPDSIVLTPKATRSNAPDSGQPGQDGWTTLPNGIRIRQK